MPAVSIEAIQTDMAELSKGFSVAKSEQQLKEADNNCPVTLKEFMGQSEDRMTALKDNWELAKVGNQAVTVRRVVCNCTSQI